MVRHELKKHIGELVNVRGIIKKVGGKKVGGKTILLCDVRVFTNNSVLHYDHMWVDMPDYIGVCLGKCFEGTAHVSSYFHRNGCKDYQVILH